MLEPHSLDLVRYCGSFHSSKCNPPGIKAHLELSACNYGPFVFKENHRLISPVVWFCLQEAITLQLRKPIKVTLPHILSELSKENHALFRVEFAKANHDYVTDAHGKQIYEFQPVSDEASYYSSEGKGHRVLQANHFCFLCLIANQDRIVA